MTSSAPWDPKAFAERIAASLHSHPWEEEEEKSQPAKATIQVPVEVSSLEREIDDRVDLINTLDASWDDAHPLSSRQPLKSDALYDPLLDLESFL